jgi:hypothetical protein
MFSVFTMFTAIHGLRETSRIVLGHPMLKHRNKRKQFSSVTLPGETYFVYTFFSTSRRLEETGWMDRRTGVYYTYKWRAHREKCALEFVEKLLLFMMFPYS